MYMRKQKKVSKSGMLNCQVSMVKKYQKIGAAHAWAACWRPQTQDSDLLILVEHLKTTSSPMLASTNQNPEPENFNIRDNCDNSFNMLKANVSLALKSVDLHTIHLWEHCSHCWMDAYQSGLETKEVQVQVQKFSSTKYKLHQQVPESVAQHFD